jgi:hypothetical protein
VYSLILEPFWLYFTPLFPHPALSFSLTREKERAAEGGKGVYGYEKPRAPGRLRGA